MGKILGINALVYVGGVELPQRNSWSLSISRELTEARVFQDTSAGASWVNQIGGFRSLSGSIGGYYEGDGAAANAEAVVSKTHGSVSKESLLLYEDRGDLTRYWYGEAWFEMSQDVSADGVITLDADFTGDGALLRFSS